MIVFGGKDYNISNTILFGVKVPIEKRLDSKKVRNAEFRHSSIIHGSLRDVEWMLIYRLNKTIAENIQSSL